MVVVIPELSTEDEEEEGDDEDGSSDEFTDSIEDDDDKVTARSLAFVQVEYFFSHLIIMYMEILITSLFICGFPTDLNSGQCTTLEFQ